MKFSECKELKALIDDEWQDAAPEIDQESGDFMTSNWRFIHQDDIDEVMRDELSSDTWLLGCFTAWFISDITGLDYDAVERAQKSESFELLGELMLQHIDKVQSEYVSADGYGHYFNSWDGCEHEFGNYYAFRN